MTNNILLVLAAVLCSTSAMAAQTNCSNFSKSVVHGSEGQKLKKFLDVQWKYLMTESPEAATYVGYPGQNDRWSDFSLAAVERRRKENVCARDSLKKIARKGLSASDKITYDLALRNADMSIESDHYAGDYMPINHMNGIHIDSTQLLAAMPAATVANYEDMLKRLDKFPVVVQQISTLMREGVKRKAMPVKAFMSLISQQLADLTPEKVEASPFFSTFQEINLNIKPEEANRLKERAREILASKVYPALKEFKIFFDKEYAPHGREDIAWISMPDGKAWYAYFVKNHTTTSMSPEQIHEVGLSEVAKLLSAMEKIRDQVKFKGDLQAFNKSLLKDKKFYYTDKNDLLAGYRDIAKRIDPELPKLFKRLPRMTYGVREIQEFAAKGAAGAQYISGSVEAGRPGYFEANTYDLGSRPKYDMETLTMHEAVPGHHLQLAIAAELKDMPEFRKFGGFTAYIEGWALYAETLGKEMGFYKDPYSYYGHLAAQMLRAVRLVVDTGMHSKGWSKEKAKEFYKSKMPVSEVDAESEINRYITWPGQALAYKVGALKIQELRDRTAAKLGDKFDIREFHDQILGKGALPLDVLEKSIDEWAASIGKNKSSGGSQTHSTSL